MLMGHLAADPELRQTKNSTNVANFPVAINRMVQGEDGKKTETVDFHRVIVWSGLATVCDQYLTKGMPVLIQGRLINRSFEDKEGNKHYRTEVVADRVDFLTRRKSKKGKEEVGLESISDEEAELAEPAEVVDEKDIVSA